MAVSADGVAVGVVDGPEAVGVAVGGVVAAVFEAVVWPAHGAGVSGHGGTVGFPSDAVVDLTRSDVTVTSGPTATIGEQQCRVAGRAGEQALSTAEIDDDTGTVMDHPAEVGPEHERGSFGNIEPGTGLGATQHVPVTARLRDDTGDGFFEGDLIDQHVRRRQRTDTITGGLCRREQRGTQCVGSALWFAATQIVDGDVGVVAEAFLGFDPEPTEDERIARISVDESDDHLMVDFRAECETPLVASARCDETAPHSNQLVTEHGMQNRDLDPRDPFGIVVVRDAADQ
jgi:hypothetical protein